MFKHDWERRINIILHGWVTNFGIVPYNCLCSTVSTDSIEIVFENYPIGPDDGNVMEQSLLDMMTSGRVKNHTVRLDKFRMDQRIRFSLLYEMGYCVRPNIDFMGLGSLCVDGRS